MRQGCRLLSDDVCVVRFGDAGPVVYPGLPRLRLWGQSLEALGQGRAGLDRAYAGDDDWGKWDVPIAADRQVREGVPLRALYPLKDGPDFRIVPRTGVDAVEALSANTYRGDYLTEAGALDDHWRVRLRLAAAIPLFQLERPRDLTRLDALGEAMLAYHRSAADARTSAAVR